MRRSQHLHEGPGFGVQQIVGLGLLDVVHVDDGRVDVQLQMNVRRRAQAGSSGAAQDSRASLRVRIYHI